jgi:hypothetical protein
MSSDTRTPPTPSRPTPLTEEKGLQPAKAPPPMPIVKPPKDQKEQSGK